jgi:intracellular multiplication protein IcmP
MAKGGGGGEQSDQSYAILWIASAVLIFGYVFWYYYKAQIAKVYFIVKLWEIKFISYFTNHLDDVSNFILTTDPSTLYFKDVMRVGEAVGEYLRIPVVIVIILLAFVIYYTNSTRSYKRIYSMRDLAEAEKVNWPQICPPLGLDLDKQDIDKGPWAMALTPMQFCKRYHLLEEHKPEPREGMTRREWNRVEVSLKRGQATKIFSIQLGPLWQGIDKLPLHVRALFAIFAAKYHSDMQAVTAMVNQLSVSSKTKLDFKGVDELCKKYQDAKAIQRITASHAYILTVMASMLATAREDGVQASADFLWLKPVDRRLWYMLNTVGRQTPFVEVAGPFAHWNAEKLMGRRLLVPMVEEATNALEIALKEIVYHPDEEAD